MPQVKPKTARTSTFRAFRTGAAFERWLNANHARTDEVWIRIYKKGSGVPTITAAEALTRALGGTDANTAFLRPHGVPESVLWVLVSVTAGVCEEIVFRGYLQRQLAVLTGSVTAGIVLQAIAFGISHGYQGLAPMAITGSYGLVLGMLAWWRGNIRAGALAHAATDIVGGLTRF